MLRDFRLYTGRELRFTRFYHTLQGFVKQPRLNRRQVRWCYYITPSDFIVYYRTGITNPDVRVNCLCQVLESARVYWRVQLNTTQRT
jgi:hypothetical protein